MMLRMAKLIGNMKREITSILWTPIVTVSMIATVFCQHFYGVVQLVSNLLAETNISAVCQFSSCRLTLCNIFYYMCWTHANLENRFVIFSKSFPVNFYRTHVFACCINIFPSYLRRKKWQNFHSHCDKNIPEIGLSLSLIQASQFRSFP